jgi:hyperosmotically inducible protein
MNARKLVSAGVASLMVLSGASVFAADPPASTVPANDRTAGQVIDDSMITGKVKTALIGDSRTKAYQIDVTTREGVVLLSGFVDTPAARAAAAEVAKQIDGVKTVDNKLGLKR